VERIAARLLADATRAGSTARPRRNGADLCLEHPSADLEDSGPLSSAGLSRSGLDHLGRAPAAHKAPILLFCALNRIVLPACAPRISYSSCRLSRIFVFPYTNHQPPIFLKNVIGVIVALPI
jgi:hypothetical protein